MTRKWCRACPDPPQGEVHGGRMKGFAQAFTEAMERACPGLPGEAGLEEPGKAPC